jgi:hypothetical protein
VGTGFPKRSCVKKEHDLRKVGTGFPKRSCFQRFILTVGTHGERVKNANENRQRKAAGIRVTSGDGDALPAPLRQCLALLAWWRASGLTSGLGSWRQSPFLVVHSV